MKLGRNTLIFICIIFFASCRKDKTIEVPENIEEITKSCDSLYVAGQTIIQELETGSYYQYDQNGHLLVWYFNGQNAGETYSLSYSGNELSAVNFESLQNNFTASSVISSGSIPSIRIYNYTDSNGNFWVDSLEVSNTGKLLNLFDKNGDTTHYYYDTSDELDSIVNGSNNNKWVFSYTSGQLTSYTYYYDEYLNGNVLLYYDENGNWTNKSYVPNGIYDSQQTRFVYDDQGLLDSTASGEGGWSESTHDHCQCGGGPAPILDPIDSFENPLYFLSASSGFGHHIYNYY